MNGPVCNCEAGFNQVIPTLPSGHIAEFGCYDGGSTRQLAKFGRAVFAFDTFTGIPKEDYIAGEQDEPGKFATTDTLQKFVEGHPNIILIVGRFADTLKTFPPEIKFAFVYLDVDLYNSQKQVLEFLLTHMVPGGQIRTDDYPGLSGIKKATDEFVAAHPDWKFQGGECLTAPNGN